MVVASFLYGQRIYFGAIQLLRLHLVGKGDHENANREMGCHINANDRI